jgi:hypothetical protein
MIISIPDIRSFEAPTLPQHHDCGCLAAERHVEWTSKGKNSNAVINRAFSSEQRLQCGVRGMSSYGTSMLSPADASQNSFSQGTLVLPRLLRPCLSAGIATYQPQPSVDLLPSFHALCYHLTHRPFRDASQITWVSSRYLYDRTLALQASYWRTHDLVTSSYTPARPDKT